MIPVFRPPPQWGGLDLYSIQAAVIEAARMFLLWCLLQGLQEGQGLWTGLPVALGECHGAEVRVLR